MPSDVFEEPVELEIGLLEAGPPTQASYPFPSLAATGSTQRRTFQAVVLENSFLRASFVPALGGRLLSLIDKRTGTDVLSGNLRQTEGGRRGMRLQAGIELHLDGRERLTSLAAVQFAAEQPDEDRPGGLWLGEAVTGTGLSWHVHASLHPDRAELRLEARVFNRSLFEVSYDAGLLMPDGGESGTSGQASWTSLGGTGLAFLSQRGIATSGASDDSFVLSRFGRLRSLAPRQLDTWALSIMPLSGLQGVSAVSASGGMYVGSDKVQIQAAAPMLQHKLVLLTTSGQTLEAPVQLYPEKLTEVALPEPATAVALMDEARNVVLKWEQVPGDWTYRTDLTDRTDRTDRTEWAKASDEDLDMSTFSVATRHIAHTVLGIRALAAGDFGAAESRFENALLYNAEDHLAWWMKAMAKRLGGEIEGEIPELLNAHYLAPLEPALRAESFLSQPTTMERAANPLLRPLAEYPDTLVEVAALLIEAQLFEQASRWIDEALRHADLPMLRYLLAYCHLRVTNMDFEAADHIAAAAKQALGPPYPWRTVEVEAIGVLSERFPADERLGELRKLTEFVQRRS